MSQPDKPGAHMSSSEFDETVGHLDISCEADDRHAAMALRWAWPRARDEYERRLEAARSANVTIDYTTRTIERIADRIEGGASQFGQPDYSAREFLEMLAESVADLRALLTASPGNGQSIVGTVPAEESDEEFAQQVRDMDKPVSHGGRTEADDLRNLLQTTQRLADAYRDQRDEAQEQCNQAKLEQDPLRSEIESLNARLAVARSATLPFIAVGYIDHQGGVKWEPGKDPNCLIPDQLVYMSHLPSAPVENRAEPTREG